MSDLKRARAVRTASGEHGGYLIHCPACKHGHLFDSRWSFNGDINNPTFNPSMLINGHVSPDVKITDKYHHRCHSFVTDGKIRFLDDCTHNLKNQTVDLPLF